LLLSFVFIAPVYAASSSNIKISLIDFVDKTRVANKTIQAYKVVKGRKSIFVAQGRTDNAGNVLLKLPRLSSNARYILKTNPYGNGWARAELKAKYGRFKFWVGTLNAQLKKESDGNILINHKADLFELKKGRLIWRSSGRTDSRGIIRFDPYGLQQRKGVFKILAINPFNRDKIYSQRINRPGRHKFTVGNKLLTVRLANTYNQKILANKKVVVYKKIKSGKWVEKKYKYTDINGQAQFDLPGLGSGADYVLKSRAYGYGWATSKELKRTGLFVFNVGRLQVQLKKGSDGSILNNHTVRLYKLIKKKWIHQESTKTDDSGFAWFDPRSMNGKNKFIFSAVSPFDNTKKTSRLIRRKGRYLFTVGNKLLNVQMVNAHTGDSLTNQTIKVYKLKNKKWDYVQYKKTNQSGISVFDLNGLGQGATYRLTAKPYGNWIASTKIKKTGSYTFKTGNLQFKVVKGVDGSNLNNFSVNLYERLEKNKWIASGKTDDQGRIWFDPAGLGSKRKFFATAKNPFDNTNKYSNTVSKPGQYNFTVGNKLLNVKLANKLDGQILADKNIIVYRVESSGSLSWIRSKNTTETGYASFDLDGLGSGTRYVLRTHPYNTGYTYSPVISKTGDFDFTVGAVEVHVVKGVDNSNLPNHKVSLYERLTDGKNQWRASGETDSEGVIRFYPKNLGSGKSYFLVTKNPFDGSTKYSQSFSDSGKHDFSVGNKLLQVTLTNELSGQAVADKEVTVYERMDDRSLKWRTRKTTDLSGRLDLDLDGLGTTRTYVLKVNPYDAGWVYSPDIKKTGPFNFKVGSVSVTLRNGESGLGIANKKLTLYEKTSDGKRHWKTSATTDASGIVRFDPVFPTDSKRIYVVRTYNVFKENDSFYSPWITTKGPVDFVVNAGEESKQDFHTPDLSISSPTNGTNIADAGFLLRGTANDNESIASIVVSVNDPTVGQSLVNASYINGSWSAKVAANMITADNTVNVVVTASDPSQNQTMRTLNLQVINDADEPDLQITSHADDDTVIDTGFLISGTVSDNTGVEKLLASIDDPVLGRVANQVPLQISESSGKWAFPADAVSSGNTIIVTIEASDVSGNVNTKLLNLNVIPVTEDAVHLIKRITFGVTPNLLRQVRSQGVETYITEQLNPNGQDSDILSSKLADIGEVDSGSDLQAYQLAHALYSKWQLREVMTWFWDNHFNTDLKKVGNVGHEFSENQSFRVNALGRFRDLLEVSATSPAMMKYLDNASSRKEEPNENYSRELLELMTMGVNGGYIPQDIVEVARVFTGWRVSDGEFEFSGSRHDDDQKIVLGEIIPAGLGMQGGLQVLDILSEHPSTARFICTKLLQVFVSDTPAELTITDCASTFLANMNKPDQIAIVLNSIFHSAEFLARSSFHNKTKTPFEFTVGLARNFEGTASLSDMRKGMESMGMKLFYYPVPTGWAEIGEKWTNSNQLFQRLLISTNIASNRSVSYRTHIEDTKNYFLSRGYETSDAVVGYLFDTLLANDYSKLEWNEATEILTKGGTVPFDINDEETDHRLRELIALVSNFPSYQLQ